MKANTVSIRQIFRKNVLPCLSVVWLSHAYGADALQAARWAGADLFTNGALSRFQIEIAPRDLEALRKEAREFVHATVSEAGVQYRDVAIHLKGSVGSFRPVDDKPALTLDFAKFRAEQRFHGLRRIHLNNSVEDPSYCNEQLGGELFRAAGIPAPRVGHALVLLDGRRLGLYVLKEGFTEDFLSCYFKNPGGNLYEPGEGHDVNQHLKRTSLPWPGSNRAALKALAAAALEPDPERRWTALQNALDMDAFIRFMALEVMIGHRDGYCLARNNFRVYQDLDRGKMVFFPHGMDQLFGSADLPWMPKMSGLVAQAIMDTPEGRQRYSAQFRSLFKELFKPEVLTNRVAQILETLAGVADNSELARLRQEGDLVNNRVLERWHQLHRQLQEAELPPLALDRGVAALTDWVAGDQPAAGRIDRVIGPGGSPCLHLVASAASFATWQAKARLKPGSYRFEAKARVSGLKPLPFGMHQGAGIRIAGQARQSQDLVNGQEWQPLSHRFEIGPEGAEVEFICEFRASAGEAWFECASLRVVQEH